MSEPLAWKDLNINPQHPFFKKLQSISLGWIRNYSLSVSWVPSLSARLFPDPCSPRKLCICSISCSCFSKPPIPSPLLACTCGAPISVRMIIHFSSSRNRLGQYNVAVILNQPCCWLLVCWLRSPAAHVLCRLRWEAISLQRVRG